MHKENNTSTNHFSGNDLDQRFREALQSHRVPSEDHVWRRIHQGLHHQETSESETKKRKTLPIWATLVTVAASVTIWSVFFAPNFSQSDNTSDSVEMVAEQSEASQKLVPSITNTPLEETETKSALLKEETEQKEKSPEKMILKATSRRQFASQINKPTKNTKQPQKAAQSKELVAYSSASSDKSQVFNQERRQSDTEIAEDVWTSDFVVTSSEVTELVARNDNQSSKVAITIKVGNNTDYDYDETNTANTDNNTQFGKAKKVLKEVWNFKTGKKVNLQNILPNHENHQHQNYSENYQTEDAD